MSKKSERIAKILEDSMMIKLDIVTPVTVKLLDLQTLKRLLKETEEQIKKGCNPMFGNVHRDRKILAEEIGHRTLKQMRKSK